MHHNTGLSILILSVLACTIHYATAVVRRGPLPQYLADCYNSYGRDSLRDIVGESMCWSCEAPFMGAVHSSNVESSNAYLQGLMEEVKNIISGEAPVGPKCRRKEYRMLTDMERVKFHNAINTLKRDNNKYDILARLHSGRVIYSIYNGPAFLPWHRIYILLFEKALQRVDPSICLPYWDCSMDSELGDPSSSYVFSSDFLGGRGTRGNVTNGPFQNWITGFGPLRRDIGISGALYTPAEVGNILSQKRTIQITRPFGHPKDNLEIPRAGVHLFLGGLMSKLHSASHDPVYFLLHCFIDYLWEVFRNQQREAGVEDPQQDYPIPFGTSEHNGDRQMEGFNFTITNKEGYSNNVTRTYEYEPSPSCSEMASCGSKYLRCNRPTGRCIPTDPSRSFASALASMSASVSMISNEKTKTPTAIQNDYCINGTCDSRMWVYVPVQVVSVRTPDLKSYDSYLIMNKTLNKDFDIYQSKIYTETDRYIRIGTPKKYDKCDSGNGFGQIFIQTEGINYNGFYKESVFIDQRQITSRAEGYLAVKDPINGPVAALFRAFDSCGRLCRTACKIPGSPSFQSCPGVLELEHISNHRSGYSMSIGEATVKAWSYSDHERYPSFVERDIIISFYCDYKDEIPWVISIPPPAPTPSPRKDCRVNDDCIIDTPCSTVQTCDGEMYPCRGTCNMYAVCSVGRFWVETCKSNRAFNRFTYRCTYEQLCNTWGH